MTADNNTAPFFTVIVPVYNRASFVRSGMEMLLGQTFGEREIILVDDGSTDGSAEICDEFARHAGFSVIHKNNGGAGSARNAGLDIARGEYICFFDIDDRVAADWLEKVHGYLENSGAELLVYGYREVNPATGMAAEFAFDDMRLDSNDELRRVYTESLSGMRFNNGFVWNKVYKRDFILRNGLVFSDLKIQQDEVFNHRVYEKAARVRIIPDMLYDYYVYDRGTVRSSAIPDRMGIFSCVRRSFLNLCDFWNLDDEKLKCYIHRRFVQNVLHNRRRSGLIDALKYAGEVFASKEVAESAEYLESDDILFSGVSGRLYRMALERKSKFLFLTANMCKGAARRAGRLYRRLRRPNR